MTTASRNADLDTGKAFAAAIGYARKASPLVTGAAAVMLATVGWMLGGVKAKQTDLETRVLKMETNETRWLEAMQDVRERLARIEGKLDQQRTKP